MQYTSIRPGQVWLDTNGNRIQAHGGSIMACLLYTSIFHTHGRQASPS